jgi:hypothetical protein
MKRTLQIAPNLVARPEHVSSLISLGESVDTYTVELRARRFSDHQDANICRALSDSLIGWFYPEVNLS